MNGSLTLIFALYLLGGLQPLLFPFLWEVYWVSFKCVLYGFQGSLFSTISRGKLTVVYDNKKSSFFNILYLSSNDDEHLIFV